MCIVIIVAGIIATSYIWLNRVDFSINIFLTAKLESIKIDVVTIYQYQAAYTSFLPEVIKQSFHYELIGNGEVRMDMLSKRNIQVHSYIEDLTVIPTALQTAQLAVPMLLRTTQNLLQKLQKRNILK